MGSPNRRPEYSESEKQQKGPRLHEPQDAEPRRRRRFARIALWTGTGIGALLLLIVLVAAVLLTSPSFHRSLKSTLEKQVSESLGVEVNVEGFALSFSSLSVDLYGVTIHGAQPYANPPLLQVEHLRAGIGITSFVQRKWYFREIEIERPVVQVLVDAKGVSNLPKPKTNSSKSNTSVFDLGIRHAVLDHGEVLYNNRPATLAADLHDFNYQGSFNSLLQMYAGNLSYRKGQLAYGTFRPLEHDFEAQFTATPTDFELKQAKMVSGKSAIAITASMKNYDSPLIDGRYDVSLDGTQIGQILRSASVPTGTLHTAGAVHYEAAGSRSVLTALTVNGSVASQRLGVKRGNFAANVDDLAAHYSLAKGDAVVEDLRAKLFGGELTAKGAMKDLAGNTHTNVDAKLQGVSLAALRRAAGRAGAGTNLALTGSLNASATAAWGKTFDDLIAKADATVSGQVTNQPQPGKPIVMEAAHAATAPMPMPIPVAGEIHATYSGKTRTVGLQRSFVHTPQTNLAMNGTVGNRSSLALDLEANDLREVGTIVDLLRVPQPGQSLQALDIAGRASFRGNVDGSTSAPHLTGQLDAQNFRFNGTNWKVIRTGVDASPSRVALQHADLEPATQGRITLNASAGLTKWSFTKTSPIEADVTATQMNVADVEKLAGQDLPVNGLLNANLHMRGSELNPQGNGEITLAKGAAYGAPFQTVNVKLNGSGEEAHADLRVQLPAGSVHGTASVRPREKTYTAEVSSDGIKLEQVQSLKARNIDAAGVLTLHANGQGSFDNPGVTASLQIPKLTIQNQTIAGVNLRANVANHVANATLASNAVNTAIQAKARVELTGDYMADASLDTQKIALQTILAAYSPEEADNVSGQTEVHATLHGPLKDRNRLEAHVTIPELSASYRNTIQLAAGAPIHIDYANGLIRLQPASLKGTDTDLQFEGSIPTSASTGPMSLKLLGTVNLQLAQMFNPDLRSSGQLKFNINSTGAMNGANLGGEIDLVDANLASDDVPVGLQHGNGVLTLTTNRINVSKFEGTIGGGTVTAEGGVVYRPGIQFDLGLAAKGVRGLYPQGMRETADAYLRFTGTPEKALLGGTVNISDISFTPAFDMNNLIGQFSGGAITPPSSGFSQDVALNIAVHSTSNVNLVSRTVSIGGSANLQVRGTAGDPVLLGRVNLDGGDVILHGTRFVLSGGTVQFINPSETEPVVNLALTTTIQQYNINMRFEGPGSQLKTQYTSDPALPQADIINLLAFGQTTEAAAASAGNTSTNQTAESLVASQVSSQVTSRVSKIAGISQLSINPVLAGSNAQGPAGATITIQQRVTSNLFVTFSTNVASTQSQTIQGQYQVSPRVAVSATRDPNGGFGFDALIKKTW